MIKPPKKELVVESTKVFSLDRCFKCLNVLKLGDNCFCSVVLRKERADTDGR